MMDVMELRDEIYRSMGNRDIQRHCERLGSSADPMTLAGIIWYSKADIREKSRLMSDLTQSDYFRTFPGDPCEPRLKEGIRALEEDLARAVSYLESDEANVYLLQKVAGNEEGVRRETVGAVPFRSVEGALAYIKNWAGYDANNGFYATEEHIRECGNNTWFRLEVYRDRNNDPEARLMITYLISADLAVLGYRNMFGMFETGRGRVRVTAPKRLSLPFSAGDVLVTDPRPFAPLRYSVLIENGYPREDDFPYCLYCSGDRLSAGSLRNSPAYSGPPANVSSFAPEMVTQRFIGELPNDKKTLADISHYLKADKNRGRAMFEYLLNKTGTALSEGDMRKYMAEHS